MPSSLHLVDATYELFRAYHAMPSIRAPDGREVGAVYGLLSSMLALLRGPDVTHAACATDHVITSFRNDLWPGYKTAEGVPPDLLAQFELAEEGLRALGLVVWPMVEFEADDALASAAAKWRDDFDRVVICTVDKDLAQCVRGTHTVMWDRRREVVYDEAGVIAKFGVPPASIADLLALKGDTADGYPGIDGWGEKTAAKLLSVYGAIDRIPRDPAAWSVKVRGADRLAASLAAGEREVALFKRLATVRADVPLAEAADDLRWRGVPRATFEPFCARQGYGRIASRPHRWRDE